jgi:hypothetical protein
MAWTEGDCVVLREIWKARVCTAIPYRVVLDSDDLLVLYLVPGTVLKKSAGSDGLLRMPADEWTMVDDPWRGDRGILRLTVPGARYSVVIPPPYWDWDGWYINLEEPLCRSALGFDYKDLLLDILLERDMSRWRWKDEHEAAEAVRRGVFSEDLVRRVREDGEQAVAAARSGGPAFDPRWREWEPDPSWPAPTLPSDWETRDVQEVDLIGS